MEEETFKEELRRALRKTVEKLGGKLGTVPLGTVPSLPLEFDVSETPSNVKGDLSTNAALVLSKKIGKAPRDVACEIAQGGLDILPIKKIEATPNGFLNFFLDEKYLFNKILKVAQEGESALSLKTTRPETILIEFVSANPTGPLHVGHGRGAALGDSLARIVAACGYPVKKEYYVNDMGVQMEVLAHSVLVRARQLRGEMVPFPENGYQGDYIRKIAEAMVSQNRDDFNIYPRQSILRSIETDLRDFGVTFDSYFEESSLHRNKKVEEAVSVLGSKNYLKHSEGALWFVNPQQVGRGEEELDKDRVLKKSDGRYTYFASDVAYHRNKFERGFSHCVDIWGHDHHGYVPRLKAAMAALGMPENFLKILLYQLVSLKRGGKRISMSTRSGTFVTLREVLDEVGVDACRFFFAMRSPNSQLEFDLDLAKKRSNENPVFYVQYVHARICSIFREALSRGIGTVPSGTVPIPPIKIEPEERDLMKKIILFPDLLKSSLEVSSPHLVTTYLIDLATAFHRFYDKHRVLDAPEDLRQFRFVLLKATQNVVRFGLNLLGVSAPEKM